MTDFNIVANNLVEAWLKDLGTMGIEWDDIASLKLRITGELEEAGKSPEIDLSEWIHTQGFDDWAMGHNAVLRNLRKWLIINGVNIK